jgi:hypothetical protein
MFGSLLLFMLWKIGPLIFYKNKKKGANITRLLASVKFKIREGFTYGICPIF